MAGVRSRVADKLKSPSISFSQREDHGSTYFSFAPSLSNDDRLATFL